MLLITFFPPDRTRNWARNHKLPYPLASDETRQAYFAYGLREASPGEMVGPQNWLPNLVSVLRTRSLPTYTQHVAQLGGYFIVDNTGKLLYAYPSQYPADYPKQGALLSELKVES